MDAGVPIKAPGCRCGHGSDQGYRHSGKVAVLTDIQGLEDFLGDMDFKVAGTIEGHHRHPDGYQDQGHRRGDSASGAGSGAAMAACSSWARCSKCCPQPREHLSAYAPKIVRFTINPDKIREVIGPGGKMINKIIDETGVKIDIEDDGSVYHRHAGRGCRREGAPDHRGHCQGHRGRRGLHGQGCPHDELSARSSSCCRARTAWCTSPSWRRAAWRSARTS